MATEEFSFPIADPAHSPIDSPPLWCLSPAASPTPSNATHIDIGFLNSRKSCSYIEGSLIRRLKMMGGDNFIDTEDDEDEKMDMLWEDLNDQGSKKTRKSGKLESHNSQEMVDLGCVPGSFKLAKSNYNIDDAVNKGAPRNAVKSNKKPNMVVLMKVFKKFFVLHHSHQSPKKR